MTQHENPSQENLDYQNALMEEVRSQVLGEAVAEGLEDATWRSAADFEQKAHDLQAEAKLATAGAALGNEASAYLARQDLGNEAEEFLRENDERTAATERASAALREHGSVAALIESMRGGFKFQVVRREYEKRGKSLLDD